MWCGVVCSVTLLLSAAKGQFFYEETNYIEEGEPCAWEKYAHTWYCRKDSDCPTLDVIVKTGAKVRTCQWRANGPRIICCPPSISQRWCLDYRKQLCSSQNYKGLENTVDKAIAEVRTVYTTNPYAAAYQCWIYTSNNTKIHLKVNVPKPPGVRGECHSLGAVSPAGGSPAHGAEFPYMALIGYGDAKRISWLCGGSIINERFVLSAAHCSKSSDGPAKWARVGDLNYLSNTDDARPQDLEIIERFVHPDYKPPAYYNDIVLFKLNKDIIFDQYVGPVCLNKKPEDPEGSGIATGWGRNESGGPTSPTLIKVDLDFVPTESCKTKIGTKETVLPEGLDPQTMMCAGKLGKDTCPGDSGGPLVAEKVDCIFNQVGVISFGRRPCGGTDVPGVYVRVSHFLHWIETIAWSEERFTIPV